MREVPFIEENNNKKMLMMIWNEMGILTRLMLEQALLKRSSIRLRKKEMMNQRDKLNKGL